MNIGDWVAGYGAVLSTITAGWAVWREARDRHRFKVHLMIAEIRSADDPSELEETLLGGNVTNVGTRTAYVKNICSLLKNGRQLMMNPLVSNPYCSLPQLPCELAPGQSCDFRLPLDFVTNPDVVAFVVTDSHGKEWRVPEKMLRDAVKNAQEK